MPHYLDHNATTPMLPEAFEAMARVAREAWGNPSSLHAPGRAAKLEVEGARESLAALVGANPQEITFTGGGTEACNFALFGGARALKDKGRHIVASAIEHAAVKSAVNGLAEDGWEVSWVRPDADGVVPPEAIAAALRPDTALCAVMHANNEVGTVQPIAAIGALLREKGVTFFCDMTQSLGKAPIDLAAPASAGYVDLAPFAAHKIGGAKGAGALFVRRGIRLDPFVRGGGQERGLRGGTENVPGIAAFGAAAAWWKERGAEERTRVRELRDALQAELLRRIPDLRVTAQNSPRLPNTLHVTFPGARGDVLVMALDLRGIAVSAGSACASGSVKPSEVLLAMGRSQEDAAASLRFSLGFGNAAEEIPVVAGAAAAAHELSREGSRAAARG